MNKNMNRTIHISDSHSSLNSKDSNNRQTTQRKINLTTTCKRDQDRNQVLMNASLGD